MCRPTYADSRDRSHLAGTTDGHDGGSHRRGQMATYYTLSVNLFTRVNSMVVESKYEECKRVLMKWKRYVRV